MKKIIIILFSFIIILFGCSSAYTGFDLENSDYVVDENGNYEYVISEQASTFVLIDEGNGDQAGIAVELYPTIYQTIQ